MRGLPLWLCSILPLVVAASWTDAESQDARLRALLEFLLVLLVGAVQILSGFTSEGGILESLRMLIVLNRIFISS